MDLLQYFALHGNRNIIKNYHYFPIYERHFRRFVGHPITMFEIGTGEGGSCQMWKYYFGPMARIVTIDIEDKDRFAETQIYVRRGSQSDAGFLQTVIDEFGAPDIVMDDGSHMMADINISFDFLAPRMSPKGTYLVEDLDGAYWADRGGGFRNPDSFVERAKNFVDEMNADYAGGQVPRTAGGEHLMNVSFYPMMVVLEKTPFLNRHMVRYPDTLPGGY